MNALKYIAGKLFSNDKLVSTIGATAEDGGIESGSNSKGNWTKFPDGTLMQWGEYNGLLHGTDNSNNFGTTSGAIYTHGILYLHYPLSFDSARPFVTMNNVTTQGEVHASNIDNEKFVVRSVNPIQAYSSTVQWQAIGRWK